MKSPPQSPHPSLSEAVIELKGWKGILLSNKLEFIPVSFTAII